MTDNNLKLYNYNNYSVIEILSDQVTVAEATKIYNGISDILKSINFQDAIIDLKNVSFIDSSGFGSLVNTRKAMMKHEKEIVLVCKNNEILQIINITRIYEFIKVFPTLDEAVKHLQK